MKIEDRYNGKLVKALVPLRSMFGYTTVLRSITKGRATHTMQIARCSAAEHKRPNAFRMVDSQPLANSTAHGDPVGMGVLDAKMVQNRDCILCKALCGIGRMFRHVALTCTAVIEDNYLII